MPLVTLKEILVPARKGGYAIGAFTFWSLDSAQSIIEAAEELKMPVILESGPVEILYAGVKNLGLIARAASENASIPVVIHLDHGNSYEMVLNAIDSGFTSVMIDSSHASFEENINITRKVVIRAKAAKISVEAELGRLIGMEAGLCNDRDSMLTDPDEAKIFVEETGVDALAVSIGTVHGFYKFEPNINIGRLKSIAEKIDIPLVLHGGSGTPEDKILEAISNGVAKINIFSEFIAAYLSSYKKALNRTDFNYSNSVKEIFEVAKRYGKELVASKIKLFACK